MLYLQEIGAKRPKRCRSFMRPRPQNSPQGELFKVPLISLIDKNHELVLLSELMEWERFESAFGSLYDPSNGRPGIATRLLVGAHYLKHLHNLSDELLIRSWVENPYWQYFCGCEYFERRFPCDRSTFSRWRKKIGKDGLEQIFQATLSVALNSGALEISTLTELLADTTVQEKNITFPTDAKLYHRARIYLVEQAYHYVKRIRSYQRRYFLRAIVIVQQSSIREPVRCTKK